MGGGVPTRSGWLKLRVSPQELSDWRASADEAGLSLSEWVRRSLNESAELVQAEREEREARVAEQARVRQATTGASCEHVARGAFCYQCGRKRW